MDRQALQAVLYNLILNPHTSQWERNLLRQAKEDPRSWEKAIANLETALRPLASRDNLTPDVADFYQQLTDSKKFQAFDFSRHQLTDSEHQERGIFAGGCFWCMVEPFDTRPGIISVLSGYTGGEGEAPGYQEVSSGLSGHVEAVEIIFDNRVINYQDLLEIYWQITDPTDALGQFEDRGAAYQPIIFTTNSEQERLAEASKKKLIASNHYKKPIVTQIKPATTFWPAENYHQEFYKKQPKRYKRLMKNRQQLLGYQALKQRL